MLVSSKEFLDIHATTEYRFTLKRVRYMIITCRHVGESIVGTPPPPFIMRGGVGPSKIDSLGGDTKNFAGKEG